MHAKLIRIGNSRGVRLPEAMIEAAHLQHDLDLEVVNESVIIRSRRQTRRGWSEAAAICRQRNEDRLDDWDSVLRDES